MKTVELHKVDRLRQEFIHAVICGEHAMCTVVYTDPSDSDVFIVYDHITNGKPKRSLWYVRY